MHQIPVDNGTLTLFPELATADILAPLLAELGDVVSAETVLEASVKVTLLLHAPTSLIATRDVGAPGDGIFINPHTMTSTLARGACPIQFGPAQAFHHGASTIMLRLDLSLDTDRTSLERHTAETIREAVRQIAAEARHGFFMHRIPPRWVSPAPLAQE